MADLPYLERQAAVIPLTSGMDLKTDGEVLPPAVLKELDNASFHAPGGIGKDNGYRSVTNDQSPVPNAGLRFIEGSPNTLLYADKTAIYELNSNNALTGTDMGSTWRALNDHVSPLGTASAERLDDYRLLPTRTLLCGDYATDGGDMEAVIYSDSALGVVAQLREISTGTIRYKNVVSNTATTATQTFVAYLTGSGSGGKSFVFCWTSAGNMKVTVVTSSGTVTTNAANLVTDVKNTVAKMDLTACVADYQFYVAYTVTTNGVKIAKFTNFGGTIGSLGTYTFGADVADKWVSIAVDPTDKLLCAYQGAAVGTKIFGMTSALTARSNFTVAAGDTDGARGCVLCIDSSGTNGLLVWEKGTGTVVKRSKVLWDGSNVSGATKSLYGQTLTHRTFLLPSSYAAAYIGLANFDRVSAAASNQRTLWTAAIDLGANLAIEPMCSYLYDIVADPATWTCSHISKSGSKAIHPSISEYRFLASVVDQKSGDPNSTGDALVLCKIRPFEGQAVSVRSVPCVANQLIYSGPGPCDTSFMWAPVLTSPPTYSNVGGNGLVAAATYQWKALFEMRLPDGTVVRSVTSNAVTGTVSAGNNTATLTVSLPMHRQPLNGSELTCYVRLYRTQAGPGGTFTLTNQTSTASIADSGFTTTLVDGQADSAIASNALIYTTGGVLDAYPWPMVSNLCLHQNRLFGVNELTNEVRYTRDIADGEAPQWHPNQAIALSGYNLDARALISTSNGLWMLGRDRATGAGAAAILIGDGPDDTGANSTYQVQRLESCDVGPTHWRGAVNSPIGIMFEDPYQGYHVLPPGGGPVTGVGLPIELARAFPVSGGAGETIAMHTLQDRKEIRCLLAVDSNTSTGYGVVMPVYHYDRGAWSLRETTSSTGVVDATVWRGRHAQLDIAHDVCVHQFRHTAAAQFADIAEQFYSLYISTGWLYFAGLGGQQTVYDIYLIGTMHGTVGVTAELYYDDDTAVAQTVSWSASDLADMTKEFRLRIRPNKRRMERLRVNIYDSYGGGAVTGEDNEAPRWNAIRVEYGTLQRGKKTRTTGVKG